MWQTDAVPDARPTCRRAYSCANQPVAARQLLVVAGTLGVVAVSATLLPSVMRFGPLDGKNAIERDCHRAGFELMNVKPIAGKAGHWTVSNCGFRAEVEVACAPLKAWSVDTIKCRLVRTERGAPTSRPDW